MKTEIILLCISLALRSIASSLSLAHRFIRNRFVFLVIIGDDTLYLPLFHGTQLPLQHKHDAVQRLSGIFATVCEEHCTST